MSFYHPRARPGNGANARIGPVEELSLPAIEEIRAAGARLPSRVRNTPLVALNERFGAPHTFLKLETQQPVGSFKVRGVLHAVSSLPEERRRAGVSTVSAGNTAQALAWSARRFGVRARSLMPETAPRTKIDAVKAYGGEPVLVPVAEVFRFLKERGWEREPYAFIHPWTDRHVMTGHGSLGLEILEAVPDLDTVFVPVGGGGLLAGVGAALKAHDPGIRLVAVEPEGCPSLHESLRAGRPAEVPCATMCDGVAVPYITGEMFPLLRELVSTTHLVSEREVKATIRSLALHAKLVVEGSGALALAAALATPPERRGKSVCLLTGGSIDPDKLAAILRDDER